MQCQTEKCLSMARGIYKRRQPFTCTRHSKKFIQKTVH